MPYVRLQVGPYKLVGGIVLMMIDDAKLPPFVI